jgi:hypothetical protein
MTRMWQFVPRLTSFAATEALWAGLSDRTAGANVWVFLTCSRSWASVA